eukprot:gb/GECH01012152.1/.p1 GENE.gb/GECH01012152.1/~~gb/GECH01012152.1/.p1  ORF type:complete len:838 (+),score=169.44 gb/GECH01012152.1/:1-2514(+)
MGQGDSKLEFRSRIQTLAQRPVKNEEHDFWLPVFTTPLPLEDLFALLSPEDVRKIRKQQTKNLSIIIVKCIQQIYYFSQPKTQVKDFTSAKNSLRILSRILPVVFEVNDENFIDTLFWNNTLAAHTVDTIVPEEEKEPQAKGKEPKRNSEEENRNNNDNNQSQEQVKNMGECAPPDLEPTPIENLGKEELNIPLGRVFLEALFEIAFLPTFSMPPSQHDLHVKKTDDSKDSSSTNGNHSSPDAHEPSDYERTFSSMESELLWQSGIASKDQVPGPTNLMVQNRIELLRCFICCFSSTLYVSSNRVEKSNNRFLDVATSVDMPHSATFFFSLLNTICSYDPTGSLPYSTVLLSDPQEEYVKHCLLVLNIILDYKKGQGSTNAFLKYAGQIKEWKDVRFSAKGFELLLNNHLFASTTYLPSSQKMIDFSEELLVLFWKILEQNQDFRVTVCRMGECNKILIPILYYITTFSGDKSKFAYVQMCTFILLLLSGEREFSVSLNRTVTEKIPFELPIIRDPNYCDLLVIVLQRTISGDRTTKHLRTLYDCMLTIICNVSPYIKSLGMLSSVKLVKMIEMFSSPKFLFATEHNPQHTLLLLQTLSNIIQYQYQGNAHTVYAILRKSDVFHKLAKLKVSDFSSKNNSPQSKESEQKQPSDVNESSGGSKEDESSEKDENIEQKESSTEQEDNKSPGNQDNNSDPEQKDPKVVTVDKEPQTRNAPPSTGNDKFVPTEEWLSEWKEKFNPYLTAIISMINHLIPEIEQLSQGNVTEDEILSFFQSTTMVGILPVPHPILIRKYHPNPNTDRWLTTYIWGLVYLQTLYPPLFDASAIKLFSVNVPSE